MPNNSNLNNEEIINELRERLAMKDRFLTLITHDLKNPISSIQLMAESLSKTGHKLSINELIAEIEEIGESARNVHTLLDNLLDWSRLQLGSFPFNPENIDLNFLINANVDLFKINALNKKIKMEVETEDQRIIFGDANMVSTITRNLISNAIKFTPENGCIIIQVAQNDNIILVSIKDSGVGINDENKKKLFKYNKGFTTHGTANEKGSGIGLVLCKEFVEKNSGKIWLESELGIGTTFFFTLMKEKPVD